MHNFRFQFSDTSAHLESVKKGTHERKRSFLDSKGESLIGSHQDYNDKASNGTLNQLTSDYVCPGDREDYPNHDYWIAYDLYASNLSYVDNHWEMLKRQNGNRILICPFCGFNTCKELDHFAPRSLFPEHSCHHVNLIPLCHDCNNDKGNKWLDTNGQQIFFNAFFDEPLPDSILQITFVPSPDNSTLGLDMDFSPSLDDDNPIHQRIKTTINTLNLMTKFEERAIDVKNKEIRNLIVRYDTVHDRYKDVDEFLDKSFMQYEGFIRNALPNEFIEKEIYRAIIAHIEFRHFIMNKLTEGNCSVRYPCG